MDAPFVWSLPPAPDVVSAVRREMRHLCRGLPAAVMDDALLLTSELVTNAVRYGAGAVTVRLWPGPGVIRLEVTDEGPRMPSSRTPTPTPKPRSTPSPDAEQGRGLTLVDTLATRWGASPQPYRTGKTVWFELDTGGT